MEIFIFLNWWWLTWVIGINYCFREIYIKLLSHFIMTYEIYTDPSSENVYLNKEYVQMLICSLIKPSVFFLSNIHMINNQ